MRHLSCTNCGLRCPADALQKNPFCRLKFSMNSRRSPHFVPSRRTIALPLFAAFLGSLLAPFALAQGTRLWTESRFEELERGTPNGVAITSDGHLVPGPDSKTVLATRS